MGNLVPEVAATAALREQVQRKVTKLQKVFPLQSKRKMKTLRCQLSCKLDKNKKKIKRIRKHTQKTTKRNPLDACEISESKPKEAEPEAVADLTQTRTHRPPDPDRKHFKCLRFHSQLKCECSRLRKARRRRGGDRGSRGVWRGRGKLAAIYSISAASLTVAISYVWQRFLVFLYRFFILPICNSYLISILQHFPVIQHNISIVINIFHVLLFFGFPCQ